MSVTISRLYSDYGTASAVVAELEAAGLPHAEMSLVSSNADNWYTAKKTATQGKIDRDADGVDDGIGGVQRVNLAVRHEHVADLRAGLGWRLRRRLCEGGKSRKQAREQCCRTGVAHGGRPGSVAGLEPFD